MDMLELDAFAKYALDEGSMSRILSTVKKMNVRRMPGYLAAPSEKSVMKGVRGQMAKMRSLGAPEEVSESLPALTSMALGAVPVGHPTKAIINSPVKGDALRFVREFEAAEPSAINAVKTPADRKALEAVMKGHELAETQVQPGLAARSFGHLSPDVMLREHNMVTTLPEQHGAVKQLMGNLRENTGEPTSMLAPYGIEYGKSPRLSRHARKHITADLENQSTNAMANAISAMRGTE